MDRGARTGSTARREGSPIHDARLLVSTLWGGRRRLGGAGHAEARLRVPLIRRACGRMYAEAGHRAGAGYPAAEQHLVSLLGSASVRLEMSSG